MPTKNTEVKLPHENATTDIQKGENKAEFVRQLVGLPPKKKEDKPAEAPKLEAAKLEEKPVKKKVAARQPAPAPTLNAEDIAGAVTAGVREVLKRDEKPEPKPSDGLSDKDKKRLSVFEQMEKSNPANAGLAARFTENLKKHQEYQKAWEAKNTGKAFKLDDEEHAEFISANDLTWDQDEYVEALTDLKASGVIGKVEEKFNGELSKVKRSEIARAEAPMVVQHQASTAKILFKELGDDFGKVLDADGNINTAEIKRLCDENPIYEKVFPLALKVEQVSGELLKIARGHVDMDEKNPLHREIVDYAGKQEQIFAKLPDEQKFNQDGKMFATSDQWEKMTKAQRAKHWVLTDRDFSSLYAMDASLAAKKIIEGEEGQFKRMAEKRGLTKPAEAAKPAETLPEKRTPPAGSIAPRMAPINKTAENGKKTPAQILFGR